MSHHRRNKTLRAIGHYLGNGAKELHKDASHVIGLPQHTIDTAAKLANGYQLPLIVGGVAVAYLVLRR